MRPLVADADTDIWRKVGYGQAGGLRQQIGHIVQHVEHRAVLDFSATCASREAKIASVSELIVAVIAFDLKAQAIGQGVTDAPNAGPSVARLQGGISRRARGVDQMLVLQPIESCPGSDIERVERRGWFQGW